MMKREYEWRGTRYNDWDELKNAMHNCEECKAEIIKTAKADNLFLHGNFQGWKMIDTEIIENYRYYWPYNWQMILMIFEDKELENIKVFIER